MVVGEEIGEAHFFNEKREPIGISEDQQMKVYL